MIPQMKPQPAPAKPKPMSTFATVPVSEVPSATTTAGRPSSPSSSRLTSSTADGWTGPIETLPPGDQRTAQALPRSNNDGYDPLATDQLPSQPTYAVNAPDSDGVDPRTQQLRTDWQPESLDPQNSIRPDVVCRTRVITHKRRRRQTKTRREIPYAGTDSQVNGSRTESFNQDPSSAPIPWNRLPDARPAAHDLRTDADALRIEPRCKSHGLARQTPPQNPTSKQRIHQHLRASERTNASAQALSTLAGECFPDAHLHVPRIQTAETVPPLASSSNQPPDRPRNIDSALTETPLPFDLRAVSECRQTHHQTRPTCLTLDYRQPRLLAASQTRYDPTHA